MVEEKELQELDELLQNFKNKKGALDIFKQRFGKSVQS
jgi:hypothetical protein